MTDLVKSIAKTLAAAVVAWLATKGFSIDPEVEAAVVAILVPVLTGVANSLSERFSAIAKFWPAPVYLPNE